MQTQIIHWSNLHQPYFAELWYKQFCLRKIEFCDKLGWDLPYMHNASLVENAIGGTPEADVYDRFDT